MAKELSIKATYFVEFLQQEGAGANFRTNFDNFKNQVSQLNERETQFFAPRFTKDDKGKKVLMDFEDYLNFLSPRDYFDRAFLWEKSKEKHTYWADLDFKWRDKVKKMGLL